MHTCIDQSYLIFPLALSQRIRGWATHGCSSGVCAASNEVDAALPLFLDGSTALSSLLQRYGRRVGLETLTEGSYLVFGDNAHVDLSLSQRTRLLVGLVVRSEEWELQVVKMSLG